MQGQKVAQYNFWNYTEDGKPLKQWDQPLSDNIFPLNKVLQDRLLYYTYDGLSLIAVKLVNGQVCPKMSNRAAGHLRTDPVHRTIRRIISCLQSSQPEAAVHRCNRLT